MSQRKTYLKCKVIHECWVDNPKDNKLSINLEAWSTMPSRLVIKTSQENGKRIRYVILPCKTSSMVIKLVDISELKDPWCLPLSICTVSLQQLLSYNAPKEVTIKIPWMQEFKDHPIRERRSWWHRTSQQNEWEKDTEGRGRGGGWGVFVAAHILQGMVTYKSNMPELVNKYKW